MSNQITLDNCKDYATEANLMKALDKLGLLEYRQSNNEVPCRFIVARTPAGRWTAIFLVGQYFATNKTGGYIGFASQYGFLSV